MYKEGLYLIKYYHLGVTFFPLFGSVKNIRVHQKCLSKPSGTGLKSQLLRRLGKVYLYVQGLPEQQR